SGDYECPSPRGLRDIGRLSSCAESGAAASSKPGRSSRLSRLRGRIRNRRGGLRSEEHTSELQSRFDLVCRLLLEKKKKKITNHVMLIQNKTQAPLQHDCNTTAAIVDYMLFHS